MNYRLTSLTPLLVGNGQALAPIDYMVWRDAVNVLDQQRIVKLLANGPRLESYLEQIRRAERLDFATWGGLAQNFAGRRIGFEAPSVVGHWQRTPTELLQIPTFASDARGNYLPASAVKGALRAGYVFTRVRPAQLQQVAEKLVGERAARRPAEALEQAAVADRMRAVSLADSGPVEATAFRIYLIRTAMLSGKPGQPSLGWKGQGQSQFAEMAQPGTVFTGRCRENAFLQQKEISRELHWGEPVTMARLCRAANEHAAQILAAHAQYAVTAALPRLQESIRELEAALASVRELPQSCLLNLGWGGGLLGKTAAIPGESEPYRAALRALPFYQRALQSGFPFPKSRRIVFAHDEPAFLPGWARLDF